MSTEPLPINYRKPFYHRIGADYRYTDSSNGNEITWREWVENDDGVQLAEHHGKLELKDHNVEALPIAESLGSFGGITCPKHVTTAGPGIVLALNSNTSELLCYATTFNNFEPPFKPLWSLDGLDRCSPYYLEKPQAIYFSPKQEVVVCDAGKQQVVWFAWPSLKVKHIERFDAHKPVAVTGSFDEGYLIGLNPVDSNNGESTLIRIDTSYQHCKAFNIGEYSLNKITALCQLADQSVLVLRCPEKDAEGVALAKVWRLDGFIQKQHHWLVLNIAAVNHTEELQGTEAVLPPLKLNNGELFQRVGCQDILLPNSAVSRQGIVQTAQGHSLIIVATGRRIRIKKSRRLISPPIASNLDQFSWDRLVLQTTIMNNTSVVVQSKTSDRLLSDEELIEAYHQDWSTAIRLDANSSPQVLVQSLPGRYLYLSLSLYGDGYSSSVIDAINIEGPRQSALQWLGPVYHQDRESRHFLDRFLSYFDVVFDEIGYSADHFARHLDPGSCPEDFLDWLASWFDWRFIAGTDVATKRRIIDELMGYYRKRGTLEGLQQLLRWYTGLSEPYPQIIEHFVLDRFIDQQVAIYPGGVDLLNQQSLATTYFFSIYIPQVLALEIDAQERLTQLVKAQKPAHTMFEIYYFPSHCVIGKQATIGFDLVVGSNNNDNQPIVTFDIN